MSEASISPLQHLVDEAQSLHSDDPGRAADLLAKACAHLPGTPAEAAAWVRWSEHVLLAHLDDSAALRGALGAVAASDDAVVVLAVARARQAMAWVDDIDAATEPGLPAAEQVRALSTAASVYLLRQRWNEAAARVERAARLAATASADAATQRAHAAMCNNLATDLRTGSHPIPPEAVELMLDLAHRARAAWSRAGGWMEVERADYQLAHCHARAGRGTQAVVYARECLAACEANGADAFERFFAHEALVAAHRSAGDEAAACEDLRTMQQLVEAIEDEGPRAFAAEVLRPLSVPA